MSQHGTPSRYTNDGCRCYACREAGRDYKRDYRERRSQGAVVSRVDLDGDLADLLRELCPLGLTDDCPARRTAIAA